MRVPLTIEDMVKFRSISTNPQHLQRRFDRHYDKLTRLTADNEAVRAKLEETTESHAEALTMIEQLKGLVDQMTEKCENLQADQQTILEETAEEKCDVSFKDENSGSLIQILSLLPCKCCICLRIARLFL